MLSLLRVPATLACARGGGNLRSPGCLRPRAVREPCIGGASEDGLTSFVLIHGTWTGGWEWQRTARLLRAAGHEVHAPTLTGCGERAHLISPGVNLDMHIRDVEAVIAYERLAQVALVAHSSGGMVASAVADRITPRIAALVYVDAALPGDGEAMLDLVSAERRGTVLGLAESEGGGYRVPASLLLETGIAETAEREEFVARATPHPLGALTQPVRLTGAWLRVPRKAYVLTTLHSAHRFREYHDWAAAQPGWETAEIASHHFPMASHPRALTELLIRLAG